MSIKRIELIDYDYITKLSIMPIKFLGLINLTHRGDTLCLIWKEKKFHKLHSALAKAINGLM